MNNYRLRSVVSRSWMPDRRYSDLPKLREYCIAETSEQRQFFIYIVDAETDEIVSMYFDGREVVFISPGTTLGTYDDIERIANEKGFTHCLENIYKVCDIVDQHIQGGDILTAEEWVYEEDVVSILKDFEDGDYDE